MFHYTVTTSKSVDEAVEALENSLQEAKFGVLWDFDLQAKLEEKGMDYKEEYRILEVCNPKEAERVLSKNKHVGYFLPCKIVVYDDGGKTMIGMPKPSALISMVDDSELQAIAEDIETRLTGAIDHAK